MFFGRIPRCTYLSPTTRVNAASHQQPCFWKSARLQQSHSTIYPPKTEGQPSPLNPHFQRPPIPVPPTQQRALLRGTVLCRLAFPWSPSSDSKYCEWWPPSSVAGTDSKCKGKQRSYTQESSNSLLRGEMQMNSTAKLGGSWKRNRISN